MKPGGKDDIPHACLRGDWLSAVLAQYATKPRSAVMWPVVGPFLLT